MNIFNRRFVAQTALCASLFIVALSRVLRAEDDSDILKFREPVVIQHGQEVTTAVSVGSYVQVDGTVRENAVSIGGDVRLGPTGVIEGDAVAIGGKVMEAPGSHVSGKVTATGSSLAHVRRALASALPALFVGLGVLAGAALFLGSIGSMALAVVVLFLFPEQTRFAREQIDKHPWRMLFAGALAVFLSIPILVFLALTVVGIPLAFIVAAILVAALVLGTVSLGQWIGLRIVERLKHPLTPLVGGLLGLFILTLLCSLPLIGVFIQIIVVCMALGAVAFSRFQTS